MCKEGKSLDFVKFSLNFVCRLASRLACRLLPNSNEVANRLYGRIVKIDIRPYVRIAKIAIRPYGYNTFANYPKILNEENNCSYDTKFM